MTPWTLLDYITEEPSNPFQAWYATLELEVQAELDATVAFLRGIDDWEEASVQEFKVLNERDQDAGLSEIRFYVDEPRPRQHPTRRRFRPLGIYSRDERTFVFLGGCEKKGQNTIPVNAFSLARHLRDQFKLGIGSVNEHF